VRESVWRGAALLGWQLYRMKAGGSRELPSAPQSSHGPQIGGLSSPCVSGTSGGRWVVPGSRLFNISFGYSSLSKEYNRVLRHLEKRLPSKQTP